MPWAKATLPYGEYLPWVEQACGLKERYARKLVQVAEWVNRPHVAVLEGITDTATLFLLSADATPDDVREWVMERCAAGSPPTRKEVQERKPQCVTATLNWRLLERLQQRADFEGRSVSNLVCHLLEISLP